MFLSDELRKLVLTAPTYAKDTLVQAAEHLEEQRRWKHAWINALVEIEHLTAALVELESELREERRKSGKKHTL